MIVANALVVPTSATAGAAASATLMGRKCVSLEGAFVGTYQLQISLDTSASPAATSWANEGTALTTAGNLEVTKPCAWARWNCTAYTSGTPVSTLAGERV